MQTTKTSSLLFQTQPVRIKGHSYTLISLIVLNCLVFVITIFFNAAATIPGLNLFNQQTGNISDKYPVKITPAGWTFSTWGIIYSWQALLLLYNLISIFRKTQHGHLYRVPRVLDSVFHLAYLSSFGFNISWLFIWDNERLGGSFGLLAAITFSLYFCCFISQRNIYNANHIMRNHKVDLWLMRIFINNGLAFYATWVTIATHLNFTIALTYEWKLLSAENSSIVALSILSAVLVTYFSLDLYFLEKYTRYTWSPYIQLAIAFAGVLTKNWNPNYASSIFSLILAAIGPGILFIIKIVVTIYKHNSQY